MVSASADASAGGDAPERARLVAPLRAIGPVLADSLREMPYAESPTIHHDPPFPHAHPGEGLMLGEVSGVLGPRVLGRALNFSFGGGDRTAGFHEPETAKRLAGLVSQYDPASLFGGPYEG